jgi:predicted ATPase/class 3 adenylate cyclase/Tfp pilus assembly protein PilF
MPTLPSGTVTFLFTDIEGSTRLWDQHPEAMRVALAQHDTLLRAAIKQHNGYVFKTVGDAFCAAFYTAPDALKAALDAQLALQQQPCNETGMLRVRMALHTGVAQERDGDYFGPTLNRVARLQAIGHGQQTLLSQITYQLVCDSLPDEVTLQDQGQHRLKDLLAPEHVWRLQHPALPTEFPPLKSLNYLPTNLPHQMTSFIGREAELAEVKQLLSSTRLLTLMGTGGAGKTRLALQVGAEVLDDYKDGVWLVELAALAEADLAPQTVASVLGLREEVGRPLLQTVQDYLRDRHLLLLVDNCEHLVAACARLVDALRSTCPHVTILATSREPLGVAGERCWRVPSLLTPTPADLPLEEKDLAAVLMEYDACRLFVERAVLQRHEFVLTRRNASALASVCHRLDGIPLAIELAAARVRSLSVEEIDGRLDQRFRLLTGGSRTALPRQQTLRATFDWSYDLLDAQARLLLGRLSLFAGGWTLEAAEQVGAGEGRSGEVIEAWEVLDLLTGLVDKSLVIAATLGDTTRYQLLETVRQYARDRLAEGKEVGIVRERHRDHFLALAEAIRPKLSGSEQAHWLAVLEEEHDNLRQALTFCLEAPEGGEAGLRLGGALQQFWWTRGHLSEGRQLSSAVLSRPGAQEHLKARADALNGAGVLAWMQGDYVTASALYEESLTIFRELGDKRGIANALNNMGLVAFCQGDYTGARALHEESLATRQELGDKGGNAASLNNLGNVAREQGDYTGARALYEQSLAIRRDLGDKRGIAISLHNLGLVAFEQGDYAGARTLHEESLTIRRELGDKVGIAHCLNDLGNVAREQGDYAVARALYEESLAIREELANKEGIAASLSSLGNVANEQGDHAMARTLYEQSLTICRELGDKRGIADSVDSFAGLACQQQQAQRAARLWGAATVLREEIGAPRLPVEQAKYEQQTARARASLGKAVFTAAFEEGRAMTLEQAVEYVLGE